MRKEATIEQWKELYEVATRIKEMKPWNKFWDLDIIGIREGNEEDTTFYSILGHGGDCYGIVVYEGYEGLNDFMMLTMQEQLNLPIEYVMFSQNNLTCYWGNREELTDKQRKNIKEMGYKYRGKNQWLYFQSFEAGYYPYNLNQDEVIRMTNYFLNLELALQQYESVQVDVDFEKGEMYYFEFGEDKKSWNFGAKPLPFSSFQFGNLIITDEELMADLRKASKCNAVLEADIAILGVSVNDKKYKRPANPATCMIADAKSGMMLKCELQQPEDDTIVSLAEELIGFIFQYGAPKEVRVSNILVEAGVQQICQICGIKLRRVKKLPIIEEFCEGMRRFM
ncbi:DUF7309 domain-containing protein [Blautia sp.]|uniref:DUF7309 domain-containing protein n=3 Tax=Clostridia TaxID=186801 RepID=UPI003AB59631